MRRLPVECVCELRGKAGESVVFVAAFPDDRPLWKGVVLELPDAGDAERAFSESGFRRCRRTSQTEAIPLLAHGRLPCQCDRREAHVHSLHNETVACL